MIPGVYRVTDQAKRVSMRQRRPDEKPYHDPREQPVDMDAAIKAVRAERLRDLEHLWEQGFYGIFDYWVTYWHTRDPLLFLLLSTTAAKHRAARVLHEEGIL